MENGDRQNKIPAGKIARSGLIGVTTAMAGIKKLAHISKKPFLSEEKERESREKNDEDIAKMIFKALSTLKGAPLKLAQMMSMEMELLPEAYRTELAKCTSQVPPMNRALIRKVITTELGAVPEKLFKEFEPVPYAAASLGQVHGAVSHDGIELAVKVQYPGISQGVKSDLEMLKGLLKLTPYGGLMNGAVKEIQERIYEELDYENEAINTNWFREHSDDKNVVIPEVLKELSSRRILTTTRIHGLHLNEWLAASPPQDERDRFGQLLCDLLMLNTWKHKVIHAYPNPGNFIFMNDGRLGVIDFGCIKTLKNDFLDNLKTLQYAAQEHDIKRIKQIYGVIGIQYKDVANDKVFENFVMKWIAWITMPIRSECFDFGANKDYFSEGMKLVPQMYNYIDKFDGSFLYFGRAEYGLYRILQRLGAKVKMNMFGE